MEKIEQVADDDRIIKRMESDYGGVDYHIKLSMLNNREIKRIVDWKNKEIVDSDSFDDL